MKKRLIRLSAALSACAVLLLVLGCSARVGPGGFDADFDVGPAKLQFRGR